MTRAVIYARYSSDLQSAASIDDQARLCREWLTDRGLKPLQVYADRALSGGTLLRPGIQSLIDDALAGKFDLVLAEALDRLSRDQADVAAIYKRLTFAGVRLVTLAEGEVGDLHVGLKGTMNALFLKDLADKTRRGLRGRIEAGRSGGGNSYGYDVVHDNAGDGEAERGKRQINQVEADIVRRIFRDYAAGKSPRAIAFQLNREGIPGPSGRAWGPSTINGNAARGTGILNNELYIGRLVWNRLRYLKDPDTGRRVSRLNPEADWIIRDAPELRIVDQELWEAVKERQQSVKKTTRPDLTDNMPFWQKTRPKYLLSGLMSCGACGGSYSKISANLFGCATARNKGTCDNRLNIRRDALEDLILDGLKSRLMAPELFKTFTQAFVEELNRLTREEAGKAERFKTELAQVERQIERLVDAIAGGADARALNARIKTLEARQLELTEAIEMAPVSSQPLVHPNLAELYRRKVEDLATAVNAPESRDEAFELMRSLIDRVVLTPEDGRLRVDLQGDLAGILALCEEGARSKRPPPLLETAVVRS